MTKINRVQKALVKNREELTAKQIAARFSLANPHDAVYKIRRRGYVISMKETTDTKNRVKNKYTLNTSAAETRKLVAAAYSNGFRT